MAALSRRKRCVLSAGMTVACLMSATAARGDLVLVGPALNPDDTLNALLTLGTQEDDLDLTGSTQINNLGQAATTGAAIAPGAAQSIGDLMAQGISSATELGVVVRLRELDGEGDDDDDDDDADDDDDDDDADDDDDDENENAVTLTDFSITLYSPAGQALFTASYAGEDLILENEEGDDTSAEELAFLLRLNDEQAAQAQGFFAAENFMGASAAVSGLDEDEIAEALVVIPEPSSILACAAGVLLLLGRRRPRRRIVS